MDTASEVEVVADLHTTNRPEAEARAQALLRALGATREGAAAARALGLALAERDQAEAALAWLREARERWRRLAAQPELLRAYADLGRWHAAWGQLDEAESALRTSIQQARTWGDPGELGRSLLGLACVLAATRPDRALLAYTEAVAKLKGRDEAAHAEALEGLARLGHVPGGAR